MIGHTREVVAVLYGAKKSMHHMLDDAQSVDQNLIITAEFYDYRPPRTIKLLVD